MRNTLILLAVVAMLALASPAWGVRKDWGFNGDGNWTEANKWNPVGVPGMYDGIYLEDTNIGKSYTITINTAIQTDGWGTDGATWGEFYFGTGAAGQVYSGIVELAAGGSIGLRPFLHFYPTSGVSGLFHQTGGDLTVNGMRICRYGSGTGQGTFKISGGTIVPSYYDLEGNNTIADSGIKIGDFAESQGAVHVKGSTASILILGGEDAGYYPGAWEQNSYGTLIAELDDRGVSTIVVDTSVSAQLAVREGDNAIFNCSHGIVDHTNIDMRGVAPAVNSSHTLLTADYIENGATNDNLTLTDSDRMPSSEWSGGPGANHYWKLTVNQGTESWMYDAGTASWLPAANNGDDGSVVVQYLLALDGDADLDGDVDDADLSILLSNFGDPGTWDAGDFNVDGSIDDSDLSILLTNFGAGTVPEPATLTLLGLGALALIRRRRA